MGPSIASWLLTLDPVTTMSRLGWCLLLAGLAYGTFARAEDLSGERATAGASPEFESEILPILRDRCFTCHGREQREGGLRFFGRADLLQLNDSGRAAVKPGDSGASELIRRVTSADDDERMPPEGKPLTDEQIATLRRWIDANAVWPTELETRGTHWAYVSPVRPALPDVKQRDWVRNDIDAFVLQGIEAAGVAPSEEAPEEVLLRRVSLDLIGLPPTVAELDVYLRDEDPAKFEKYVDRLLASPQYGVKWARHWLDLARYADSNGYQADQFREIWPYRDWVIAAMNADMPFDRFTIEQLAGDLLPGATLEQQIATGFQRCTTCNVEAGVDPEENRVNQIVDRVNTTGMVWLGTTLECAQCHNHKYDPFTMEDYYSLFAFYNNTPLEVILPDNKGVQYEVAGPTMPLPLTDLQQRRRAGLLAEQEQLSARKSKRERELAERRAEFLKSLALAVPSQPQWHVLTIESFSADGDPTVKTLDDGSLLLTGANPAKTTYTISVRTKLAGVTGFRLDTLTHDSLPGQGPGRGDAQRPNFVLYEFSVTAKPADDAAAAKPVAFAQAEADFSQANWNVAGLIDGKSETGWGINPQFGKDHWARFVTREPLNPDGAEVEFTFDLPQHYGGARTIGRLRLSAMTGDPGSEALPEAVRIALAVPEAERDEKQLRVLADYQRSLDAESIEIDKAMKSVEQQLAAVRPTTTPVMVELDEQRATRVMKRGNFLDPGADVSAATPAALHALGDEVPRNRLGLAQWLMSPENPLVRRVVVNRWWAEMFGEGIVRTPEDFGTQGEPPTHPELLDWLADELLRSGWSMKALHRLIVTSATYRQSSRVTPDRLERDPYNKLLARGPRIRLSAESIRDNALRISGLLSETLDGPPIYPPQPENIWRHVGRNAPKYNTDADERRYRRGVYVVWRRSAPYPSFVNFDAPDRASCVAQRSRTNTPLQALTLLNDPVYVEMTRAFAERILNESPSGDPDARIRFAFRACTAREPSRNEVEILARIYRQEIQRLDAQPKAVEKLVPAKGLSTSEQRERAVWFAIGNILLNLDETITKE